MSKASTSSGNGFSAVRLYAAFSIRLAAKTIAVTVSAITAAGLDLTARWTTLEEIELLEASL